MSKRPLDKCSSLLYSFSPKTNYIYKFSLVHSTCPQFSIKTRTNLPK